MGIFHFITIKERFVMKKFLILFCFLFSSAYAWDGYNVKNGDYIEIDKGQLVRTGEEIEIYNYSTGEYEYKEVNDIYDNTIETYDYETGEYETFDMD